MEGTLGTSESYEWSARIRCDITELSSSFSVFIFCGDVLEEPEGWEDAPTLAQQCPFMASPHAEGHKVGIEVEAFAHLSDFLLDTVHLRSLKDEVVLPYLQENLNWRIKLVDGIVIPSENFKSLEITVIRKSYHKHPGQPLPKPGEVREYPNITHGRPGGSKSKQE